jgi:hypothetical protein
MNLAGRGSRGSANIVYEEYVCVSIPVVDDRLHHLRADVGYGHLDPRSTERLKVSQRVS